MNWVTIIWSMAASASFTLAAINLLIWSRKLKAWAHAFFALTAIGVALMAAIELLMAQAGTAGQFGAALRWYQVPVLMIIVSLVGFIRLYLRAGRPWLAWTVCGLRVLSLIINFISKTNLNYREISSLRHIRFLGESVSIPEGVSNPWMLVGQASLLLLVVFAVDATLTAWRRGARRQAGVVGGSIIFFTLAGLGEAILVLWRIIPVPLTTSFFFLAVVGAMALELSVDTLRASELLEDLRESETRVVLAADSANVGFWSWDFDTGLIWATQKTLEIYGFSPNEKMTFDKFLGVVHPDDRDRVGNDARRAFQEAPDFRAEYRIVLPDKSIRWISAQAKAKSKPTGEPRRMLGVSLDITQRRQNESEMVELRLELAHLARVLAISELSTSLAHEINQPLGAILNNAEAAKLLLSRDKDRQGTISEILEDIIQDTQRAGDVVRKIRGMAKKSEAHFEPLPVDPLIKDVLKLVNSTLSMNNITLQLDLKPDLADVKGDRVRLQQVLMNLIANAIHAMNNTPSRTLTVRSAMEAPDIVTVSVSDSGTGIDKAKQEAVFRPFFTTKKDGLGFGLSICRSIIEEHGGRIWGENNPTGGATFSFSLKAWKG
jgi:PAS domain S-box-containing protein